ncbi:ABC transporter permease [Halapricum desulfuricans]|uniref:ABC-type nitrate/sulfonate/bicarbonate transportsystem, permease component n=1 Tax=Halapricum desulfuricans TaxID=2841257 RepID=A0A897NRY9_9EURY|nr:ABC transporter permease [Halapricum desulfuricans]QSG14225.1 ABC-type nitrate/sulfonate/bicarbonate transportsystem, permease component [Halapricum desulfuricans]
MATDVSNELERTDNLGPIVEAIDPRRLLLGLLGLAGFVGLWWFGSTLQPAYILPSPLAVAVTVQSEIASGTMQTALLDSVVHWLPGTVVGTTLGVAAGVALGWSRVLDEALTPVVRVLRPVPPLALIGFAIAWFGIGHAGAAFIIAIGAFWINFYAAYGGVEGVSDDLLDVARSLGVERQIGLVRAVVLPASLPEIMTGIRTGIGRCWMLVVAAEIFGAPGIGRQIFRSANSLQVDRVIAYILVLSVMFLLVDTAFRLLQRRVLSWR